ncbi:unnamed protein product [Musa acuminata subsp. burmannicoides]
MPSQSEIIIIFIYHRQPESPSSAGRPQSGRICGVEPSGWATGSTTRERKGDNIAHRAM